MALAACCAVLAPQAAAQEGRVVVAFVPGEEVLERTELSVGLMVGDPELLATPARDLDAALAARRPGDVVIAIGSEPGRPVPVGVAAGGEPGLLTSATTRRPGLVAAADLEQRAIEITGARDAGALRALDDRLEAIGERRLPAGLVLLGCALLLGLRRGALAVLWAPTTSLLAAALDPSLAVELALVGPGSAALALMTDRAIPWPRAPAVPALAAVAAYSADLLAGSDAIGLALLGPNPLLGARFHGIGNELEAILPLLALAGVAAVAGAAPRSRGLAVAFGGAMALLAAIVGAGRLGADVGGVVTIAAAGAVAVLWSLPGRPSRRATALALAAPAAALAALAALDLATGADSHFSRTVLHAEDAGELAATIGRRYELAWQALTEGLMAFAALAAVAAAALAVRRRATLYAPIAGFPAWRAALAGGLAGAIAGTLSNDSGPLLLVLGVLGLAAATAYLRASPAPRGVPEPYSGGSGP